MTYKRYTKIEDDVFECLLNPSIKDAELKILLFFIRYTKGFGRSTVRASYSYIAKGTGYSDATVKRIIKKFISDGIIEVVREAQGSKSRIFKVLWSQMTTLYGHTRPPYMVTDDHDIMVTDDPQDITEDITDKDITDKIQISENTSTDWSTYFDS